jgi:predicted CxxxxCH...CXXCH cytochrome family protein
MWLHGIMGRSERCQAMNENEVTSVDSVKKCPICDGELERGYAIAYRGFWWDTQKRTLRAGKMKLLSTSPTWTETNFPALRCSKCHIIIFDYEKRE